MPDIVNLTKQARDLYRPILKLISPGRIRTRKVFSIYQQPNFGFEAYRNLFLAIHFVPEKSLPADSYERFVVNRTSQGKILATIEIAQKLAESKNSKDIERKKKALVHEFCHFIVTASALKNSELKTILFSYKEAVKITDLKTYIPSLDQKTRNRISDTYMNFEHGHYADDESTLNIPILFRTLLLSLETLKEYFPAKIEQLAPAEDFMRCIKRLAREKHLPPGFVFKRFEEEISAFL